MDLAKQLASAGRATGGARTKVDALFGGRPDVLDGIKVARANGASHATIARILSSDGATIKEGAVRNWLLSQGIE